MPSCEASLAVIGIVAQHGRHHAGSSVGRRRNNTATRGVFLVHGNRIQAGIVHRRNRLPHVAGFRHLQPVMQRTRTTLDLQAAGQFAVGSHSSIDAIEHDGDETVQPEHRSDASSANTASFASTICGDRESRSGHTSRSVRAASR